MDLEALVRRSFRMAASRDAMELDPARGKATQDLFVLYGAL